MNSSFARYITHLEALECEILDDLSEEEAAIFQAHSHDRDKEHFSLALKKYPELVERFLSLTPAQRRAAYEKNSTAEAWADLASCAVLVCRRGRVLLELLELHPLTPTGAYREMAGSTLRWLAELEKKLDGINL